MGFSLKGDFDTSYGSATNIYITIGSFHFKKYTGIVFFNYTYWINKSYADKYYIKYEGQDTIPEPTGKLSERIVIYPQDNSQPRDYILPHGLEFFLGEEQEVEVPKINVIEKKEQVPFITFDKEGNEIISYREELTTTEQISNESVIEKRKVLDLSMLNNIYSYGYSNIKKHLSSVFSEDSFIEE
jgi:hypothetical protein